VWVAVFVFAWFGTSAQAAEDPLHLATACEAETSAHCESVKENPAQLFRCLIDHKGDASAVCLKTLNEAPAARLPKPIEKQGVAFAVLGGLGLFPSRTPNLSYGGWDAPSGNGGVVQHRFTATVPVYHDSTDAISLSLGGASLHFGQVETLSGSNIQLPTDLWKIELGASFSRKLEDDKFEGARLSIGSASDQPFDGIAVTTFGGSAYYSWASSETSRWMLTVFVSNNNPILNYIPIPGFVYIYQKGTFVGMFGFPFTSLIWSPVAPWMFSLSAFGPTINAETGYGNPKGTQLFTGFSWTQQSFLREGRGDPKDRLYYDEKHLPIGVRFPLFGVKSELSTGYTFDRSLYEGTRFGKKENGIATLDASWYYAWNLKVDL
jgi:hypothetical protein